MSTAGSRCCKASVRKVLCAALCGALYATLPVAYAQSATSSESVRQYNIPAGSLSGALSAWGVQGGKQVVFAPGLVTDKQTRGATGQYSAEQALTQLLAGTGLAWKRVNGQTYALEQAPPRPANGNQKRASRPKAPSSTTAQKVTQLGAVTVTGSRIRGAPPASPVIDISQEQMIQAGQTNLGEVIRDIPQNFSGGQNPGVETANGVAADQNITGGSALNLRGLGPDATLTLVNGQRLAYGGFAQAIDISQIPLAAVNRIEINTTGASAIYGSDAVAGVANVILKPDYNGLSATARLGEATSGGDFQQQYSVVGGTTWATGGFIATANYEDDTAITGQQRDYTSYLLAPNDILPTNKVISALFSGHQELGEFVTFKVLAMATKRNADNVANEDGTISADYRTTTSGEVSPSLTFHLPATWTVSISGVYGRDRGVSKQPTYTVEDGTETPLYENETCYCNMITAWGVDSEGPLFRLPGGDARIALGAGYRENGFNNHSLVPPFFEPIVAHEHSYYAYGELYLPMVSPDLRVPLIHELSFSGALRRENYNDFGGVTTPQVGIIYAPTGDFDLKASWGKSFKTPDLLQAHQQLSAYLWSAAQLGGVGYPSTATALMSFGGNPDLLPERASTWTATLGLHPLSLPNFQAQLSYFHINFKNRVALGIINIPAALSDPAYQPFVNLNPTLAQQQDLLSAATTFINFAGVPYNPANVIAITDERYLNITAQKIHGVDLSASYELDWDQSSLTVSENASLLLSRQQNSVTAPVIDLSGTVFNPPRLQARLGAIWERGPLTLSAFYRFIGGVTNIQSTPSVQGSPMQIIDLTGIYHLSRDVDLSLSIKNLTNERPPFLSNQADYDLNYDSTNYSAIGRFVGVSVTKRWR